MKYINMWNAPRFRVLVLVFGLLSIFLLQSLISFTPTKLLFSGRLGQVDLKGKQKQIDVTIKKPPKSPRYMSWSSNPIYFLHIGKAGGSSIDRLMPKIIKQAHDRKRKREQNEMIRGNSTNDSIECEITIQNSPKCQNEKKGYRGRKKYIGNLHFDWSYIQKMQKMSTLSVAVAKNEWDQKYEEYNVYPNADVITFLRHPVSRAISQFYFSQGLHWARKAKAPFINMTLEEYLVDYEHSGYLEPLTDGTSGVSWLAGTTTEKWIFRGGDKNTTTKESLRKNKTASCLRAASRLDQTIWFGLMEDVARSMKLLQITMDLDSPPIMPRVNVARKSRGEPSEQIFSTIQQFLPQDLWLHEYSKRLFEARWDYFTSQDGAEYVHPDLPPLPQFDD